MRRVCQIKSIWHVIFFIIVVNRVVFGERDMSLNVQNVCVQSELNQFRAKLVQRFRSARIVLARTDDINFRVRVNFHNDLQKNWPTNSAEPADQKFFLQITQIDISS